MDQDGNLYPEFIALHRQLSMNFAQNPRPTSGVNRPVPPVPVTQLTAADAFANALDGSRLSHRQHPYRLVPSTAYPSRMTTYQRSTSMRSSSTGNSANNRPQPIPPTPPRVRNGIAEGYIPYLTPADHARDPARLALLDRAFEIFTSQMDHMRSSYPASAQSQNSYSSAQHPIPSSGPTGAPAQSHNSYSSLLHRIPLPPSPSSLSQPPFSFSDVSTAPAQSQSSYSSPQFPIPSSVPAPAPAQSHDRYSPSSLNYIPFSPSPSPSSSSDVSSIQSKATANYSEDESSLSDDDLRDPLIDINTPPAISDLLLAAIEVKPFMLQGETRRPETFITQFDTYADLLKLNDEQKRVLFARYAYRDNDLRFKALKYDRTYEDAKTSFLELVHNNAL